MGGILVSSNVSAATKFNITVKPVLSVEMTTNPVSFEADSTLHTGYVNLNVVSNNETGFTATMTTNGESTSLNHATDSNYSIPSITSESTSTDFPLNHWGYSVDNGANFAPIPALGSTPATVLATTKANDFGRTNIFFGVKVDDTNISGIYQNTILVTVVPNFVPEPPVECNPSATTIAAAVCMQDMNQDIVSSMTLEEQYQLIDNRDEKTYFIAKLQDGKVWMTQNLDLNLDANTKLTPENTDLNSEEVIANGGWTPIHSTIDATSNMTTTGTSATITGWTNDNNTPYSVDPGDVYFDGTYFTSSDCNYLTTNCNHFAYETAALTYFTNGRHGHIGNYYNWSAAVASNDTSSFTTANTDYPDSICPKGWRLPHDYGGTSGNDFATLVNAYGGTIYSDITILDSDQTLLNSPLFFIRAGGVLNNSLTNDAPAYIGRYWSSTVYSSYNAYNLYFVSSYADTSTKLDRKNGVSVRCVAR